MTTFNIGDLVLSIRGSHKGQTGMVIESGKTYYCPTGYVRVQFDGAKSHALKREQNLVPEHLAMDEGL